MKHCELCSKRSKETRRFIPATHLLKVKWQHINRADTGYYHVCETCMDTAAQTMKNVEIRVLQPVKLPFMARAVAG